MVEGGEVPKKQTITLICCASVTVARGKGPKNPEIFCGHDMCMVPKYMAAPERIQRPQDVPAPEGVELPQDVAAAETV